RDGEGGGTLEEAVRALKTKPGAETLDPAELAADKRGELAEQLEDVFGTPAKPSVAGARFASAVAKLELGEEALARGSVLYRRHCVHCHGLTGDGRGPTGPLG